MNFTAINLLFANLFLGTFILSQDLNSSSETKVLKKWSKEFISGVSFPIIKKEDKLITPLLDGNLQILDFKTGETINRYNFGKGPILEMSYFNSNLSFIMPLEKKSLRIYNIDLEKHILKKKNKFTLKYSVQSESDSLIIGNDYRIGSINKINGDENWVVKFETPIVSKPYISDKKIIVLNQNNEILILSFNNGEIISRTKIKEDVLSKKLLRSLSLQKNDNLYVTSYLGNFFSFNLIDNKNNWLVKLKNYIYVSPIINKGNVFVCDASGKVISLNASNGYLNWEFDTKLLINQDPMIINDELMIITEVGKIFFFDQLKGDMLSSSEIDGRVMFAKKIDEFKILVANDSKKISLFEIKNN